MANEEIRRMIEKRRLKHFEVAVAMGLSPNYFSHLLQTELKPERKKQVITAIRSIK